MPACVAEAPLETFSASWRVGWRGQHRLAMLTSSLADPSQFIAYGTDGQVAFRVQGRWRADLSRFMNRMAMDEVEVLPPPLITLAPPPGQPSYPDPFAVQRCFNARMGAGDRRVSPGGVWSLPSR